MRFSFKSIVCNSDRFYIQTQITEYESNFNLKLHSMKQISLFFYCLNETVTAAFTFLSWFWKSESYNYIQDNRFSHVLKYIELLQVLFLLLWQNMTVKLSSFEIITSCFLSFFWTKYEIFSDLHLAVKENNFIQCDQ